MMSPGTLEQVLHLPQSQYSKPGLTGGAPEMHPLFRYLVNHANRAGQSKSFLRDPGL